MTIIKKKSEYQPTHRELVQRAGKWLLSRNYYTVLLERQTFCKEVPDAIGWASLGDSAVVEVKVSRADFLADLKKPHRNSPDSFGAKRYYYCTDDVIDKDELPDGWGLIYAREYHSRFIKESSGFERSHKSLLGELAFLARTYRKVGIGVQVVPLEVVTGEPMPLLGKCKCGGNVYMQPNELMFCDECKYAAGLIIDMEEVLKDGTGNQ